MAAFEPKLLLVLREGYGFATLKADLLAGLTVVIVAIPLAMALAIASGASPDRGLVTVVVAGFLVSALGGSRVQIGGPTGAFVVVIADVILRHGYDGLLLATLLAGGVLLVSGWLGFGRLIRFIPRPVITGFTAGIAVLIASSQIKDFIGLQIDGMPSGFMAMWQAYFQQISTTNSATLLLALATLAIILSLRKYAPRWPGFLIATLIGALVVGVFDLSVATVGARFPDLPAGMPMPSLPAYSWERVVEVAPSAFTIAFLAGVEALLSAVVADGMAGTRHKSNQELMGQGLANIGSALFGGLPATGAIARTATNVRAGGRTPVAGMAHALFALLFLLYGMELVAYVPMAVLAAILLVVAWGMSEYQQFIASLRMPNSDRSILLVSFLLTIFVDLTVAISVGVILAALLFMAKLSDAVSVENGKGIVRDAEMDEEDLGQRDELPEGIEVFRINGPIFFGVVGQMFETLRRTGHAPKVIIIRMRLVPLVDASGVGMFEEFVEHVRHAGVRIILSGVQPQPLSILKRARLDVELVEYANSYDEALEMAGRHLAQNDSSNHKT